MDSSAVHQNPGESPAAVKEKSFWRPKLPYIVGALLAYAGAFGVNFIGGSSILEARVAWALVWGTLMWPFFVVPQILIQLLIQRLIGKRLGDSSSKRLVALNLPIAVLVVAVLGYKFTTSSPRHTFEYLVVKPVPASVRSVEQGALYAMDSVFRVLRFEISKSDLHQLLDSQHFVPIKEDEEFRRWDQSTHREVSIQKEEYLKRWKDQIRDYANLEVGFTKDWQVYNIKEGHGQKYV